MERHTHPFASGRYKVLMYLMSYVAIFFFLLRRTAGRSFMRAAADRAKWRKIGEAYVQQWTVVG
jgi:hypothetical protein